MPELSQREVSEAISEIKAGDQNGVRNVIKLIDVLISDLRVRNDTAMLEDCSRNQGGIAVLMRLREYIR